jgi:hypothetical protein
MSFTFDTECGKVVVEKSTKKMTPFGGLVAFASFLSHLGVIERLVKSCPVQRSSPNATPIEDLVIGFILTCVIDGKRFAHIRHIQADEVIAKAFGVKRRIPGEDSIRRFFEQIDSEAGRTWICSVNQIIYGFLDDWFVLDWDSTVTIRYGEQEMVEVGYNPTRPGRGSHHPLVCTVAGSRLCLDLSFRSGDSHSAAGWKEMLERLRTALPEGHRPLVNRADVAFCSEEILSYHEAHEDGPYYLFRLKKSARVKEALAGLREEQWQGPATIGVLQVAECTLQLMGWNKPRRVVLGRRLRSHATPQESGTLFGTCVHEYHAWVTDLDPQQVNAFQVAELYQKRADCENIFDELKNQWGLAGFCSQHSNVTELAARFTLLSYNLWSLFVRFFDPAVHREAKTSRKQVMLIASNMIETARTRILQMAAFDGLWERIEAGYQRLQAWLGATAPQLALPQPPGRKKSYLVNEHLRINAKLLPLNCGI